MNIHALLVAVSSLPFAACVADTSPGDTPAPAPAVGYTRTIVRTAPDGTRTVSQESIVPSQQAAEAAQLQRALDSPGAGRPIADAIATTSCSNFLTATKLFDQPNYTGNEICFLGATPQDSGFEVLGNFCRVVLRFPPGHSTCVHTWQGAIQSLWTGQASLLVESQLGGCADILSAAEAQATPTACDAVAFDIGINVIAQ